MMILKNMHQMKKIEQKLDMNKIPNYKQTFFNKTN